MRMTTDHFLLNRLDHGAEIEEPPFLGNAGLKNNLE
jgi:hypothetical protein